MDEKGFNESEPVSTWTKLKYAVIHRIKLILVSLIAVTIGFYLAGYPVLASSSITLAWVLVTLFVSMSTCLLSPESKKNR